MYSAKYDGVMCFQRPPGQELEIHKKQQCESVQKTGPVPWIQDPVSKRQPTYGAKIYNMQIWPTSRLLSWIRKPLEGRRTVKTNGQDARQ